MRIVSRLLCLFELMEHPVAPVGGQRVDPCYGFDLGSVERARQACAMRQQHADTRGVTLDHPDRTGDRNGCRLQHPKYHPVRPLRTKRLSRLGRPVIVA
jgi:hypothetical protein